MVVFDKRRSLFIDISSIKQLIWQFLDILENIWQVPLKAHHFWILFRYIFNHNKVFLGVIAACIEIFEYLSISLLVPEEFHGVVGSDGYGKSRCRWWGLELGRWRWRLLIKSADEIFKSFVWFGCVYESIFWWGCLRVWVWDVAGYLFDVLLQTELTGRLVVVFNWREIVHS